METTTIPTHVWNNVLSKLDFIEKTICHLAKNYKPDEYMFESEVMERLGLKKRQLYTLRIEGKLEWVTTSGRKIKYKRKSVEDYIKNK